MFELIIPNPTNGMIERAKECKNYLTDEFEDCTISIKDYAITIKCKSKDYDEVEKYFEKIRKGLDK